MKNGYLSALGRTEKKFDSMYREVAAKFGLSHCAMWVMYNITNADEPLSQQELADIMMFPKQTVNSAVMGLVKNGFVTLEVIPDTWGRKSVLLTNKGKEFAERTVIPMTQAELRAVSAMGEEKIKQFVSLYCEFCDKLHNELERDILR